MPNTQTNAGRSRIKSSSTISESWGDRVFIAVVYFMLTVVLIAVLYPLIYIVSSSLEQSGCRLLGKSLVVAH